MTSQVLELTISNLSKKKILSFVKKKNRQIEGRFFTLDIMVQNLFEHLVL